MSAANPDFVYDEVDEGVWRDELAPFLPKRIFDFHGHIVLAEHWPSFDAAQDNPSLPVVVREYSHEAFAEAERRIFPGRDLGNLVFGWFDPAGDIEAVNAYVADAAKIQGWSALMVSPPMQGAGEVVEKVRAGGFVGLKPYWTFVTWKEQDDVTLEDMITAEMREAADRLGLIVMTHIPRRGRLADPVNIAGIRRLCDDAPNAKIILAHFGRSYFPDMIGDGLSLADIPNLYIGLSMIQDWEVIEAVLRTFDRKKILFGMDLPFAQEKGKLVSVNGQRHFFTKRPHKWSAHVEADSYEVRCTLFAYEIVRAIKKAAGKAGLDDAEVEDIFCNNAERLIASVR